jgi:hypothetical protein
MTGELLICLRKVRYIDTDLSCFGALGHDLVVVSDREHGISATGSSICAANSRASRARASQCSAVP